MQKRDFGRSPLKVECHRGPVISDDCGDYISTSGVLWAILGSPPCPRSKSILLPFEFSACLPFSYLALRSHDLTWLSQKVSRSPISTFYRFLQSLIATFRTHLQYQYKNMRKNTYSIILSALMITPAPRSLCSSRRISRFLSQSWPWLNRHLIRLFYRFLWDCPWEGRGSRYRFPWLGGHILG